MKLEEPIAILGFGTEGKAALDFLQAQNYSDITVCDQGEGDQIPEGFSSMCGADAFDDLSKFKTIIRSPGVNIAEEGIQNAKELGVEITSMTKLTLQTASDRITAVTGTNGKTTTSALLEQILHAHYGDRLIVGGNDREPVLQKAIDQSDDPILMEVSSFQFADLEMSPYMAAVLNISPNHLNWHETLEDYTNAKTNILLHQGEGDWALLNANDENSEKLHYVVKGQLFWIGEKRDKHWAVWEDGYLQLSYNGKQENIVHFDQLNFKTHPDNILFAAAMAMLHMVPTSTIEEQIKQFRGVEHRLEYIRTLNDVHFYNDSSSTSPESAMAAIDQFPASKLILMLGGSSKKADFTYLAQKIVKNKVRVVLYGAEKQRVKESILVAGGEQLILSVSEKDDFSQLVKDVQKLAKSEDSIVLSPACASFDMFKNAKARGEEFKKVVSQLA